MEGAAAEEEEQSETWRGFRVGPTLILVQPDIFGNSMHVFLNSPFNTINV